MLKLFSTKYVIYGLDKVFPMFFIVPYYFVFKPSERQMDASNLYYFQLVETLPYKFPFPNSQVLINKFTNLNLFIKTTNKVVDFKSRYFQEPIIFPNFDLLPILHLAHLETKSSALRILLNA